MLKAIGIAALVAISTGVGFDVIRNQIAPAAVAETVDDELLADDQTASIPVTPDLPASKGEMDILNEIRRGD